MRVKDFTRLIKNSLPVVLANIDNVLYLQSLRFVYGFDINSFEDPDEIQRELLYWFMNIPDDMEGFKVDIMEKRKVTVGVPEDEVEAMRDMCQAILNKDKRIRATRTGLTNGRYEIFHIPNIGYRYIVTEASEVLILKSDVYFNKNMGYIISSDDEGGFKACRCSESADSMYLDTDPPVQMSFDDMENEEKENMSLPEGNVRYLPEADIIYAASGEVNVI